MSNELKENGDEFVTGDLPSVNPPVPDLGDDEVTGKPQSASDATLLKMQEGTPAGTAELIRKTIPKIEELEQQKKALSATIKAEFNKLKEHKIDTGPVKFVLKQRKLELEYRNAYDLTVRLVRNALGESQLSLLDDNSDKLDSEQDIEDKAATLPTKKSKPKAAGKATGNPAAKKAAEAKGNKGRAVKLAQFNNRPTVAH